MKYKVTLNGRTYEVEVEVDRAILTDEYEVYAPAVPEAPAAAPAKAPAVTAAGKPVNSPMPGTILSVEVSQGAAVKSGQLLLVLESMKMENEIFAPCDGTVVQILAEKGRHVETDSPLIILA